MFDILLPRFTVFHVKGYKCEAKGILGLVSTPTPRQTPKGVYVTQIMVRRIIATA